MDDELDGPEPPDLTLRYGQGGDHVIDVRLPAGTTGPHPVLVLLHGGFWRQRYDRTHAFPTAAALAERGYIVAVPEYRRVRRAGDGWPATFDDVAAATDNVAGLLGEALGQQRIDSDRLVIAGHSAGGQLALWAAARHRLPADSPWRRQQPLPISGVVSLAGVCDLALSSEWGLGDDAADDLLGGSPSEHPDRYAATNPAELVPSGVPATLVHGTKDHAVPAQMSRDYAAKARAAGDSVDLRELAGYDHFAVIDPDSPAFKEVTSAIDFHAG